MVYDLPLFPLNTVLFPGMPISLHIFEDRYKLMIGECVAKRQPFGVVLIKNGREAGQPATPQAVGCTANIAQLQPLQDGRMNLVAIGHDRFYIHTFHHDKPYLVGTVESLPLRRGSEPNTAAHTRRLRQLLTSYLELLSQMGEVEFDMDKLPTDPLELAYLTATLIQAPAHDKQQLLVINHEPELVTAVYHTCRYELAILKAMAAATSPPHAGPFSLN
jgi:uncharacterized protein